MSTALVRAEGSVGRTHFTALCGSLACQETGEHSHIDCPECGRVLMPGLAGLDCWTCRLACYGGRSRNYPYFVHALPAEDRDFALDQAVSRLRRYEVEPARCNHGHVTLPMRLWDCPLCTLALRGALLEIYFRGDIYSASLAATTLGLPAPPPRLEVVG